MLRRASSNKSKNSRSRGAKSRESPAIGAGASTDGQVLVFHDLLGIHGDFRPKFVKPYADLRGEMVRAMSAYTADVRARRFPGPEHTYGIAPEELHRLEVQLPQRQTA